MIFYDVSDQCQLHIRLFFFLSIQEPAELPWWNIWRMREEEEEEEGKRKLVAAKSSETSQSWQSVCVCVCVCEK